MVLLDTSFVHINWFGLPLFSAPFLCVDPSSDTVRLCKITSNLAAEPLNIPGHTGLFFPSYINFLMPFGVMGFQSSLKATAPAAVVASTAPTSAAMCERNGALDLYLKPVKTF